jgi:hypothetical protein
MITRRVCQLQRRKASRHCHDAFGAAWWAMCLVMRPDERSDCFGDTTSPERYAGRSKLRPYKRSSSSVLLQLRR